MRTLVQKVHAARQGADQRRQAVLDAVAKDPCALDVLVWAAPPLAPQVMDRIFDFSWLVDPMVKWAILAPCERHLRRVLQRVQSLMMAGPIPNLPPAPAGPNPYLVPVNPEEKDVFSRLVSRAAVVVHAGLEPPPAALVEACRWNFVDLIDCSEGGEGSGSSAADVLAGQPHRRGSVLRLQTQASAWARAGEAVALVRELVHSRETSETGACDGGHLCATGTCPKCAGAPAARL
mmetsp:Transcript_28153/g.51491  ORF Transcript_28153/g.51491 Transcript_28153/m.51491 type:complete len:234 (+) Transcript_28153:90-791(+)